MSANLVDAQVFVLLHQARQSAISGLVGRSVLERADRARHFAGITCRSGIPYSWRSGECGSAEQQWAEAIA